MTGTAIFGGSFNPIHFGHLLLADEVLEHLGLDRVVFVPAGAPPHKPASALAPAVHRHAMVKLATADHPRFEVSDIELRRSGPSYTVDTLAALHTAGDPLFLLVGSETFLDFLTWREPRRIAELARLVVVPRAGSAFDSEGAAAQKIMRAVGAVRFVRGPAAEGGPTSVLIAPATSLPISSSELRRRAREGRSLAYRVPDSVGTYIRGHRLYQDEVT